MRIDATLPLLLVMAVAGADVAAQQAEEDETQRQTTEESGSAPSAAGTAAQPETNKESQGKPTRFVPRETISPDSVIAFPADI